MIPANQNTCLNWWRILGLVGGLAASIGLWWAALAWLIGGWHAR